MKTKDLITIGTVALGTATLTVGVFCGGPIEAGGEPEALAAKIEKPKLVAHGVEFTIATAEGRVFKAGEQPEFELTAVNKGAEPASVLLTASMTASSPADAMSRVIRMPMVLWHQQQMVEVKAGETKMLKLTAATNLPPGSFFSVRLDEAKDKPAASAQLSAGVLAPDGAPSGIVALSFSTATLRNGEPLISMLSQPVALPTAAVAPQQMPATTSQPSP